MSLHRHPNGIQGKSFFQKDVGDRIPDGMATVTVASRSRGGEAVAEATLDKVPMLARAPEPNVYSREPPPQSQAPNR